MTSFSSREMEIWNRPTYVHEISVGEIERKVYKLIVIIIIKHKTHLLYLPKL